MPEKLRFSAQTVDGASFNGASLAGQPAVLWFWAPWCPNCRAEAPAVARAAAQNGSVSFVGVASQDEQPAMKQFIGQYGVGGFPHLNDASGAIWSEFGVTYQPAYAFISKDGSVDVVKQNLSDEEFAQRVSALAG